MKRRFKSLMAGALVLGSFLAWAQKPKSPKEQEALAAISAAKTPDDQLKAIEYVLTKFADTEYKVALLQMALQVEDQKGDYAQTVFYAERLLEADPKNPFALVTLAAETARHTREFDLDKEEKLAKVDKWAKAGIEAAKVAAKPQPQIPDEVWEGAKKDLQAQAWEAMGMSASLRKKNDDAIAAYKEAMAVSGAADPATLVRLGQAYMDAGKFDDATASFDKALNSPNVLPQVKTIAQAKKEEAAKRKAAGAKP